MMYLMQIVAYNTGSCGAKESDVVRDMAKASNCSPAIAQFYIDMAVQSGQLRRVRCPCQS